MKLSLLTFALKNLKLRWVRSVLTAVGIALAMTVLLSLLGFNEGYRRSLERNLDGLGYEVLVTAKGCPYEAATLLLRGGMGLRYIDAAVYDRIAGDTRVAVAGRQLIQTVFDPYRGTRNVQLLMGIDENFGELRPWASLAEGTWFRDADSLQVILGWQVAEFEQRRVGDLYYIKGINKNARVVGIFDRAGTQEDGTVFLPLATVQRLFELEGRLTGVGVKMRDVEELSTFLDDVYEIPNVQVVSMTQVRNTLLGLVRNARVIALAVAAVALALAFLGVANTILLTVNERTREIGIMKAIGASHGTVFRLIWIETLILCAVGGLAGVIVTLLSSRALESLIRSTISFAPVGRILEIRPEILTASLLGMFAVGLAAGFYPAFKAARLSPMDAIRRGE